MTNYTKKLNMDRTQQLKIMLCEAWWRINICNMHLKYNEKWNSFFSIVFYCNILIDIRKISFFSFFIWEKFDFPFCIFHSIFFWKKNCCFALFRRIFLCCYSLWIISKVNLYTHIKKNYSIIKASPLIGCGMYFKFQHNWNIKHLQFCRFPFECINKI